MLPSKPRICRRSGISGRRSPLTRPTIIRRALQRSLGRLEVSAALSNGWLGLPSLGQSAKSSSETSVITRGPRSFGSVLTAG